MKKRDIIFGLITGILGLVLAVGVQTFAKPCVHADGSAAVCAPVKTWLTVEGGVIAALAGISMIRHNVWTQGLAAVTGILAVLTPGIMVPICKMDSMACRKVMQPAALVLGILIAVAAAWWAAVTLAAQRKERRS